MTFDVRAEGGGVTGVLRTGTQSIIAPLQKGAAFVVNPMLDLVDSVTNVATLRENNQELQRQIAELQAQVIAIDDELAKLELLEQIYDLESSGTEIGRTVAEITGRPDPLDAALIIDKGSSSGIAVGQPVIDTNGYVVGSVQQVTAGSAIIVPITVGSDGVAVTVDSQIGVVVPQVNQDLMRLEINPAEEPVLAGAQVVTSSQSVRFPAGYPVGRVVADAAPSGADSLTTQVEPYANPDTLRVVVVLAWPPDPVAASTQPTTTTVPSATSTTTPAGSTTVSPSTTTGDG